MIEVESRVIPLSPYKITLSLTTGVKVKEELLISGGETLIP